jgi:hypothetical protein
LQIVLGVLTARLKINSFFTTFQIFEFFKERISIQYPLDQETADDPYFMSKEAHESFMKQRCQNVFGRAEILKKVCRMVLGK